VTLLVLELDEGLALHLTSAVAMHARHCRDGGLELPAELQQLAATCWRIARGESKRTEANSLDELVALLDGARVPRLLCTITEAAKTLQVSERQVEKLVASGALPSVLIARSRRIRLADLEQFVASLGGNDTFREHVTTKAASIGSSPRPSSPVGMLGRSARTRPAAPARSGDVA
jgi:excisionase family DNA binding protein